MRISVLPIPPTAFIFHHNYYQIQPLTHAPRYDEKSSHAPYLFLEPIFQKLEKGISNAEFHYLGSGKVMAGIGIGFAEAVLDLQPKGK
jgi:hypothetical protein